jgi:RNA polymerase sigma-70 factor (ECF subfamily)
LPLFSTWPLSTGDSDGQLVSKAARGDRRAFDALVRTHEKALRGFVSLRVRSEGVDDVMQDVWTACWVAIPKFAGRSRFKAWLYGIATNKCVDYLRAGGRRPSSSLDEIGEVADAHRPYDRVDDRDAVMAAVETLPDVQREVVQLYYYADLTLPEIAQTLKRNLNTVKYQFYRAHQVVAKELGAEESQRA